ncbi:kinase-like protein [Auricularia subglabra TFB-10046 SS5]|nr:kinase-like protein [Auricularia subglabra TFB-10046 SS5]
MRPSDNWETAEELAGDYRGAHKYWLRMPFDAIERVASACKNGVACRANRTKYAAGMYNLALELVFDDGDVWIARLSTNHYSPRALAPADVARRMRCEVATLRLVAERTAIPVPRVFAFCETPANDLGWPYILMSALAGRAPADIGIVHTGTCEPIPAEKQSLFESFCASLADVHVQLRGVAFDAIGAIYLDDQGEYVVGAEAETGIGPCASSAEYFAQFGAYLQREARVHESTNRLFGVWLARLLLSSRPRSAGPFSLTHQDLHTGNILVDQTGRITGVLDWDAAACLPREFLAAQAVEFVAPLNQDPEKQAWADAFNRALAAGDPELAALHDSTPIRLVSQLLMFNVVQPELYDSAWFLEPMCRLLLGTTDWECVQQAPVFREWRDVQFEETIRQRRAETARGGMSLPARSNDAEIP